MASTHSSRRISSWQKLCVVFGVDPENERQKVAFKRLDMYGDDVVVQAIAEAVDTFQPSRDNGQLPSVALLHELCRKARKGTAEPLSLAGMDASGACDVCRGRGVVYVFRPRWSGELVVRDGVLRRKVEASKRHDTIPARWHLVGIRCTCAAGRVKGPKTGFSYGPTLLRSLGWALEDAVLAERDNVPDLRGDVERYKLHCEVAVGTQWGQDVQHPAVAPYVPGDDVDGEILPF